MAFSFGGSDVVAGIKLAVKIYEYGFAHENRADVRYNTFRNDIFNFSYLLGKLNDALKDAQERFLGRRQVLGVQAHEPLSEDFERERKTIIGNFLSTLQECEDLLNENQQLRLRSSNVLENLHWNLSQQEQRVDILRRRLHFHSEKIRLVLDRLSIKLLTDLDAKVDDILALSEQNLQLTRDVYVELNRFRATWLDHVNGRGVPSEPPNENAHSAQGSVAQKFEGSLRTNAPRSLDQGVPLAEGFDALLVSFQQSTDGPDHTHEKYLLFLKSRWLLERIKEGQEFERARPGYYYKRAISQIEQAILARVRIPGELIAYDESVLLTLKDSCFDIWPAPTPRRANRYIPPHPLMVRANEEKVTCIELASAHALNEPDSVTIFKSSDERLRIVLKVTPSVTSSGRQADPYVTELPVYVPEDKCIPRYALPTLINPSLEMAIFSRGAETLYNFDSFKDLSKFQTALIGFDLSHYQDDIRCQFSDDAKSLDCSGRVQLWQDPISPLPNSSSSCAGEKTSLVSSEGSHSRNDSLSPTLPPSSTVTLTPDGWEADNIKLPSLVIFTQLKDNKQRSRLATIYIELERGIYINPEECKCCRDYEACSKLVLTKTTGKSTFTARVSLSELGPDGQPDPNTFDIFPLRLPRHPNFHRITPKQTEYLLLKFASLEAKKRFHRELHLRFLVRDQQIKDRQQWARMIRHRQDRPQRLQSPHSPRTSDLRSSFDHLSVQSAPTPPAGGLELQGIPSDSLRQGVSPGSVSTVPGTGISDPGPGRSVSVDNQALTGSISWTAGYSPPQTVGQRAGVPRSASFRSPAQNSSRGERTGSVSSAAGGTLRTDVSTTPSTTGRRRTRNALTFLRQL